MLHNEKDLFEKLVLDTSEKFGIVPVIVEKDYYVTLFLREMVRRQPGIIFKGGTSLSKCYHLINRFSEDVDLNIESEQKPTEGQRRSLVYSVRDIINEYGFILKNADDIRSRRDYNRFDIDVHSIFSSGYIKHDLIVETAVFLRAYPSVKMQASSYVYEYLKSIGREDIISEYELEPFELQVQAVERTFVDKIFALCDYFLDGKPDEHSRHLYDIYKMSSVVEINEDLKRLFQKVREERKEHKACLSAQNEVSVKECLQQIVDTDSYQRDYETITRSLLFKDDVRYEEVKRNLQKIIDSGLFD